jgi:hypothetical protein
LGGRDDEQNSVTKDLMVEMMIKMGHFNHHLYHQIGVMKEGLEGRNDE